MNMLASKKTNSLCKAVHKVVIESCDLGSSFIKTTLDKLRKKTMPSLNTVSHETLRKLLLVTPLSFVGNFAIETVSHFVD